MSYLTRLPEVFSSRRATPQWLTLTSGYLRLTKPYPLHLRFYNGQQIKLENRYDLATLWLVFFPPTYPLESTDRRILDLGANLGAFTLYAASQLPSDVRIVSVEPFPPTFDRLTWLISTNKLEDRVSSIRTALAGQNGEVHFNDNPGLGSQFRNVTDKGMLVPSITLESLFDRIGWDEADFVKIDIEGSEYDSLLASPREVLRRMKRISMEYHPDPRKQQLIDHLQNAGFKLLVDRHDGGGYGLVHFVRV